MTAPVVVIGGGLAGLVAANRAAELGVAVTVFEQGAAENYPCNARYANGVLHINYHELSEPPADLLAVIEQETANFARADLAKAMAETVGDAYRWVRANGAKVIRVPLSGAMRVILAPPRRTEPGGLHEGQGGDHLLRALTQKLAERGGRLVRGARAASIGMADGRCAGVTIERDGKAERIAASAVAICDGGFQGNPDMVRQHLTARPERMVVRNAATGRGDGLRMALALGAASFGMDRFYGHLLARRALHDPKLWPYPVLDSLALSGIVVGPDGRRVMDEGGGGVFMTNEMARLDDPAATMVIFDQAIWTAPTPGDPLSPNPYLLRAGGELFEAPDLASLAAKAGLPADALRQTVEAYNAAVANGTTLSLTPMRSTRRRAPAPIVRPPFYAAPMCGGITYSMGGMLIDGDCRVLRADGTPIPGLYAAGSTTGGLEGGPVAGYLGGLGKAITFGYRAGGTIAREVAGQ